jgi:hypothetical protein
VNTATPPSSTGSQYTTTLRLFVKSGGQIDWDGVRVRDRFAFRALAGAGEGIGRQAGETMAAGVFRGEAEGSSVRVLRLGRRGGRAGVAILGVFGLARRREGPYDGRAVLGGALAVP